MLGLVDGSARISMVRVPASGPALRGGGTFPEDTACSSASGFVFVPNGGRPSTAW